MTCEEQSVSISAMSNSHATKSRTERERARAQAQALKEKEAQARKRTIIIAAVVALVLVGALVAILIATTRGSSSPTGTLGDDGLTHNESVITLDVPANVTSIGGISVGKSLEAGTSNEGAPQVDIFFDYACSHCYDLEKEYGKALQEAAKNGEITLVYHPVSLPMDEFLSPTGIAIETYVAANEPESYIAVHNAMHENMIKPLREGTVSSYPTTEDIAKIAQEAGLSEKTTEGLKKALDNDELTDWGTQITQQFVADSTTYRDDNSYGTPTVFVDGKHQDSWSEPLKKYAGKYITEEE